MLMVPAARYIITMMLETFHSQLEGNQDYINIPKTFVNIFKLQIILT